MARPANRAIVLFLAAYIAAILCGLGLMAAIRARTWEHNAPIVKPEIGPGSEPIGGVII